MLGLSLGEGVDHILRAYQQHPREKNVSPPLFGRLEVERSTERKSFKHECIHRKVSLIDAKSGRVHTFESIQKQSQSFALY